MIEGNRKECPFCGEFVWANDTYCKHCDERLDVQCPFCGEIVSASARICPHCSMGLTAKKIEVKTPWANATSVLSFFYIAICIATITDCTNPNNWEPPLNTIEGKIDCLKTLAIYFALPLVSAIIAMNDKKEGVSKAIISLVVSGIFGFLTFIRIVGV